MSRVRLGVNVDHIATLRQQRRTPYPDLRAAIRLIEAAGADGITMHLREDRRHVQLDDVERARADVRGTLNLEMAATEEMIGIARRVRPDYCCLVPERRAELTTEGGLDARRGDLRGVCARLQERGIKVSLFIDPNEGDVDAALRCAPDIVELHTGPYALATGAARARELSRLARAAAQARGAVVVNAGHGLHAGNVGPVAALAGMHELNIGHALVCRAVLVGLTEAVRELRAEMDAACA